METDNAEGLILGLACGDALGRPVEFKSATQIERLHGQVTEMLDSGTHNRPAGTITDDTELALCIAQSLVDSNGFDPADVASRFVNWYDSNPFDVGMMTSETISRLKRGDDWDVAGHAVWETRPEGQNAGNGSVMRCAPYAIAFADQPERLLEVSRTSSAITHADPRCTYGCAILNRTLAGLLKDESSPLESALDEVSGDAPQELLDAVAPISGSIQPDTLQSSGYVIHTLQAGLYHGLTATTPRDAIVNAVNMGNDTDTVGAVTGAVVGARFGANELPSAWVDALTVDEMGRSHPDWWPGKEMTETAFRDLARQLTEL